MFLSLIYNICQVNIVDYRKKDLSHIFLYSSFNSSKSLLILRYPFNFINCYHIEHTYTFHLLIAGRTKNNKLLDSDF